MNASEKLEAVLREARKLKVWYSTPQAVGDCPDLEPLCKAMEDWDA